MPRNFNKDKLSNYSIEFSGSEYIDLGTSVDLGINSTISFWFKSSSGNPNNTIIGEDTYTFDYLLQIVSASNEANIRIGSVFKTYTGITEINDGNWNHWIIVRNGDSLELFINNTSKGTKTGYGTGTNTKFNKIGAEGDNQFPISGEISQVSVFNYALDLSQINYLYNLNNPMAISGAEPVAYWPLGDNSNPNAPGSFPNISVGADSVFEFDGSVKIASLANSGFTNNDARTFSAWVKTTDTGNYRTIVQVGPDNNSNQNFELGAFGGFLHFSSWSTYNLTGNVSIADGNWHFVCITFDGSVINGYVDGASAGPNLTNASVSLATTNTPYFIGGSATGNSVKFFNGQISNVQIWNTELSSSEVTTLYNSGVPLTGTQPQASNLKAWYKLDQSANWEADSSGAWQIPDAVSAYPQSFDFDGSNDFIDLGTTTDYNNGDLTAAIWVNASSSRSSTVYAFSNSGSPSIPGFDIKVKTNNQVQVSRVTDTQNTASGWLSIGFVEDSWQHLAFTYNESTNSLKLFLNGVLKDTSTDSPHTPKTSTVKLTIGSYKGISTFWQGQLSNAQIWNTTLSDSQIETLYNNGVPLTTAIASDNLKAWYKLDNTATFSTNWVVENSAITPNFNKAIDFVSSSTQYIDLTNTGFPTGNASRTISAWIKSDSTGQNNEQGILRYGTTATRQLFMMSLAASSGQLRVATYADDFTYSTADLRDDAWHHVALTYDGTSIKGYVDGSYVGVETNTLVNTTANSPAIGNWNGAGFTFNGAISNVLLYTESLTDANILTLYNNGTPQTTPYGSPFGWWKLDNLVTGIQDSGSGGNNGTLVNSPLLISTDVKAGSGISSGMTEQNLVNNNVSVLNGESVGMNTTNLVQSNLTRTQPYSSYSFNFDAAQSDYFDCGNILNTTIAGSFSVSAWMKSSNQNNYAVALSKNNGSNGFSMQMRKVGNKFAFNLNDGSWSAAEFTVSQIDNDEWYHVVGTFDGSTIKIYVNGASGTSNSSSTPISTSASFFIGKETNGNNFNGQISNVSIFNEDLSQDDVLNLYNNGVPQNLNNFRITPIAWWPMDEHSSYYDGTDWVVRDLINGNDGDGANTGNVDDLVGSAPGSEASGTGTNLTIADLKGNMSNSDKNAYSINMADYADGVTNPANSGRSTNVP